MALDLNAAGVAGGNALSMSPRQIYGLWRSYQAIRPDLEKRAAVVARAAQAEQNAFEGWLKDNR